MYLERNDNQITVIQNLWDGTKAVLRGTFRAIQCNLRKQEKTQVNNVNLYLKQLEKEQTKPKINRRKEIINIRAPINVVETKKIAKIIETKNWFFKINKIDKPLARLLKTKRGRIQISKNRIVKEVTTDTSEIEYHERLPQATI